MSNVLISADIDMQGSGYGNIVLNLAKHLVNKGHEPKILGNDYKAQPHYYPFSIIPSDLRMLRGQIEAIKQQFWPNILLMVWDIPSHKQLVEWFSGKGTALYCGIFAVEAAPLAEMEEWVSYIRQMDIGFCISKFGLSECEKAGLTNCVWLPVGIDMGFYHPMDKGERELLRMDLNLDDKFVVLTVADNHFRKNIAAGVKAMARLIKDVPNAYYVIVARPHSTQIGWSLNHLAGRYGIQDNVRVIHSRPTNDMLLRLYQASDVYLCTSLAEGLGLPILEAQACGLPVIGTDCTAIHELLDEDRGILIKPEYWYTDPWGNTERGFINVGQVVGALHELYLNPEMRQCYSDKGIAFAKERNFEAACDVMLSSIEKVRL